MDSNTEKAKFIMTAAKALHRYGASSDRVENALKLISNQMGLDAEFLSTPTSLIANFNFNDQSEYTSMIRLDPGKANLEKLSSADETVDLVLDGHISIDQGRQALNHIISKPMLYRNLYVNIALAVLAFSAAIFLKGSLTDAIFSGSISLIISMFSYSIKQEKISTIIEAIIAFIISFTALALHQYGLNIFPPVAILASLLYYLPGLMLTMAIHELSSDNLIAGTSRLTGAMIILLKIAFGTYLGTQVATHFFGTHDPAIPTALGQGFQFIAILFVSLAFCISFQAQKKNFVWIILGCLVSFYSSKLTQSYLGIVPSAFVGGFIVGSGSNAFSIIFKRPAMILSLPMIILLVPGSVGYQGLSFFFQDNPLVAISTIFTTVSVGMALVAGSYFGNIVVPPKRTL